MGDGSVELLKGKGGGINSEVFFSMLSTVDRKREEEEEEEEDKEEETTEMLQWFSMLN